MPALDTLLQQKLALLENKRQKRVLHRSQSLNAVKVRRNGRELISFSGNDYLGLSHHPDVLAAAATTLTEGAGAGASRLVTGNHAYYEPLEKALADYKGMEAACIFGSGYLANIGIIPALMGKNDLILADKLAHACMLDGATLSGATVLRFAHNNAAHCRLLLEANRQDYQHCLIMTETVFSMDGDRAPLAELHSLALEFDSWLMTDDAHGFGVLPKEKNPADIQMGTLSKAVGSYGGYVCASRTVIDYLHSAARSLVYSTALPPMVVAAALAAVQIIARDASFVGRPLANARYFTGLLGLPEAQSAIVPLVLQESDKALAASAQLETEGFLVAAIRPPTVPEHTARLRFAFNAWHDKADIERLASYIQRQEWICVS